MVSRIGAPATNFKVAEAADAQNEVKEDGPPASVARPRPADVDVDRPPASVARPRPVDVDVDEGASRWTSARASSGFAVQTPTQQSRDFALRSARADEERLRAFYLRSVPSSADRSVADPGLDPGPIDSAPPTTFTLEDATSAIDSKIDPRLGNMDPVLAARLSNMDASPTWAGAIPPGSSVRGVWFRNFYLDGNDNPDEPDAQIYTYDRDGTLYTFEVAGSFAQAYRGIDPGLPGSNSRLGLPVSGQEVMQPDHPLYAKSGSRPVYYQNFEHGTLVETRAADGTSPAQFTWYDRNGDVVVKDFEVPGVDLSAADVPRKGDLVKPVDAPLTRVSEFAVQDDEGAPAADGTRYHAAKDWFAPPGTTVRAPVDGRIIAVTPSRGNSGQVFGGAVYVQGEDGRVWVFRHVDPNIKQGDRVRAGDPIAAVTDWADSPNGDHTHIELWKTWEGGYTYENMIDPMSELSVFL